jgi:peptidoglycan/LPS O-acetylase OafA/YrhL
MIFRHDINGLRAIAVVIVVLFHFGLPGFSGGFVGVDVFFVISGFLMTGIIFTKLQKNQFSVLEFYLARARRIIPALAALCLILLFLAWFLLPPYEYDRLGKHIIGAATFLSNIVFFKESGYFDASSHEKWLLHTWSLSVEWQFYIIYPVLILVLRKMFSMTLIPWMLLSFALGSFLLSAFLPDRWAVAGFYLLPTRAWEMMLGGLVFLFALKSSKKMAPLMEFAGLALIIASTLFLDASVKWPGWMAILPVAGAVLILVAARDDSWVTQNRVAQYLGATSYSLYLWHWPVVVALSLLDVIQSPMWICVGILLSMIFAHLSYRFIEQYWRAPPRKLHPLRPLSVYASVLMVIAAAGFVIFRYQGIPARVDTYIAIADGEQRNRNPRVECMVVPSSDPSSPMCIFGKNTKKIAVIVIGDSHSNTAINAIADAIPDEQGGALFLGADGCISPVNIATPYFASCGLYNQKILTYLRDNLSGVPVIVVNHMTEKLLNPGNIAANRAVYLDGKPNTHADFAPAFLQQYTDNICGIAETRRVFIMQPIPDMGVHVPQTITRAKLYGGREIDVSVSRNIYNDKNKAIRHLNEDTAKICGAETIDPVPYLCDEKTCLGSIKNRPLYYDDNHLSEYGSRLLTPMFSKIWNVLDTADVAIK